MTYDGLNPDRNAIIDVLLPHPNIFVNLRDHKGRSVLWHAANTRNRRLVRQLAQLPGTDIETPDDNGVAPLDQASNRGDPEIIELVRNPVNATDVFRCSLM